METKEKLTLLALKREVKLLNYFVERSNWRIITTVLFLTVIGFIMIYSGTVHTSGVVYVAKQLIAFLIGLSLLFLLSVVNYQIFQPYYKYLYGICIFLLVAVLLIGTSYRNTRAWIDFKIFTFQPSEVVKILYTLFLCSYFDKDFPRNNNLLKFFIAVLSFVVLAVLLLLEPDFSAAVVYFPIIIVIFYLSGINKKLLTYVLLFATFTLVLFLFKTYMFLKREQLLSLPVLNFFYHSLEKFCLQFFIILLVISIFCFLVWWILKKMLFRVSITGLILTILVLWSSYALVVISHRFVKLYQQRRIIALLDPYYDPAGAGYQVIQTKVAIGSGRFFGKGLFKGTQTKLGFVPEKHTDFIFSLICEEFGFLGASIVVFLYLFLILEGLNVVYTSRDSFGGMIASAIVAMFGFYFCINVGMCLGLMPVVGLPLPFISYGGSNLISSYMAVGLLNSIYLRRYMY